MKRYTNAEIESLSKNPCVKLVKEDRLILTYEFRTEIYKHWVLHPCYSTIRRILEEHGFDRKCVEINYIKDLHRNFKRHGKPRNGKRELASRDISSESDINKLLESGKFIKSGKGIAFAEDFVEQLRSKYPEQTIEEGLRNAGINPEIVGYQRIYHLGCKLTNDGFKMGTWVLTVKRKIV